MSDLRIDDHVQIGQGPLGTGPCGWVREIDDKDATVRFCEGSVDPTMTNTPSGHTPSASWVWFGPSDVLADQPDLTGNALKQVMMSTPQMNAASYQRDDAVIVDEVNRQARAAAATRSLPVHVTAPIAEGSIVVLEMGEEADYSNPEYVDMLKATRKELERIAGHSRFAVFECSSGEGVSVFSRDELLEVVRELVAEQLQRQLDEGDPVGDAPPAEVLRADPRLLQIAEQAKIDITVALGVPMSLIGNASQVNRGPSCTCWHPLTDHRGGEGKCWRCGCTGFVEAS